MRQAGAADEEGEREDGEDEAELFMAEKTVKTPTNKIQTCFSDLIARSYENCFVYNL